MEFIKDVLERIKPTEEEQKFLLQNAEDIISKIKLNLIGVDADPILVGSLAKGTNLKDTDVDIFIRFSTKYDRSYIEEKTIEIGKKILESTEINFAEHPYIKGKYRNILFEIVPCYRIEDSKRKITSVDRTPFHTEFVIRNLKEWQKDEVRLLKQFLKGLGIYGAEAKIEGFSGYLTELLIIKYGKFLNVLKNVIKWKKTTFISLNGEGTQFNSPLTFIDPTDPKRNVASAVSMKNYAIFIFSSREFLKNPKINFFFPNEYPEFDVEKIKSRGVGILHIKVTKPNVVDDILYTQIKKFSKLLEENLNDFGLTKIHFYVDDFVHLIIEAYHLDLPALEMHEGPPVWNKNSENFIKKWKGKAFNGPYIIDGKFYADIERKYKTIEDAIRKIISSASIGKDLDKYKEEIEFSRDPKTINRRELSKFLDYKFPWEL
ncbi:MAG: CCA tRNA nucleotidyltransferase [Thermoplasmata archaeon]